MREDELDVSTSQLGHGSCVPHSSQAANSSITAGSSQTLQPRHNRPSDFVHRTRDAGVYMTMFSY